MRSNSLGGGLILAARFLLLATLALLPWANGAVDHSVRHLIFWPVAIAVTLSVSTIWYRLPRIEVMALLALAALAGLAQLFPIFSGDEPLAIVRQHAQLRQWESPASIAGAHEKLPLSVDPASTRVDLALFVVVIGCFFVGSVTLGGRRGFMQLCWLGLGLGVALSVVGIVQSLAWNGKLLWIVPAPDRNTAFGPFVYHNLAANVLCLCFGCSLAILTQQALHGWMPPAAKSEHRSGHSFKLGLQMVVRWRFADLFKLLACATILCGILSSQSRGACVAVGFGLLVTCLACLPRRSAQLSFAMAMLVTCLIVASAAWISTNQVVGARLATLLDEHEVTTQERWTHWQTAIASIQEFWLTGTGLGTYDRMHHLAQTTPERWHFDHAHNAYLELFADLGVVAPALILLLLLALGRHMIRPLLSANREVWPMGIAGVFTLSSQAVHSFFDYCLHLPASVLFTAAITGAVCGTTQRSSAGPITKLATSVLLLLLVGSVYWSAVEQSKVAVVESALNRVFRAPAEDARSLASVESGIAQLTHAVQLRPDDCFAQEALAELWINKYRLLARDELTRELGLEPSPELWQWTSALTLHHRACSLKYQGRLDELRELQRDALIVANMQPAREHLLKSWRASPTLARVHLRLEELSVLGDFGEWQDRSPAHTTLAAILRPDEPANLFHAGRLEYSAFRYDAAWKLWYACLERSTQFLTEVTRLARAVLSPEGLVDSVLPANPSHLVDLAILGEWPPDEPQWQATLLDRADSLLDQGIPHVEDQRVHTWGRLALARDDLETAADHYRDAIKIAPSNMIYRSEYAQILAALGDYSEAERQAQVCIRTQPQVREHRRVLRTIRLRQQLVAADPKPATKPVEEL